MQTTNVLYKLNLYRPKIILVVLLGMLATGQLQAQKTRWVRKNNPNYDDRTLSYGFLIGLHSSALQIEYSDQFVTPDFDTVYAVHPLWSGGFSLGLIVNYKAAEYLDLRLTPKVSFYEHRLKYIYTDNTLTVPDEQLVETTMVEFPILAKYKSARRGNIRMYMIGGVTPGIEASGKKKLESGTSRLELNGFNFQLEGGFGFDLYYPLFKFSPELRFSRGIVDVLGSRENIYGQPLRRATTNTVTLYLLFQ